MARIILSGIEPHTAAQLAILLASDGHEIHREKSNVAVKELLDADAIFAGGEPYTYLPALRRIRAADAERCFVVVTRVPDTSQWLEALEAGATDYWSPPFDLGQVRSLIKAIPTQ